MISLSVKDIRKYLLCMHGHPGAQNTKKNNMVHPYTQG